MALPSQKRSKSQRLKSRGHLARSGDLAPASPVVFYVGRDASTGQDLVRQGSNVIPAWITGNARPVFGMALVLLEGERNGLPLVLGPSTIELERRIVTLPRGQFGAAVLFTKETEEPGQSNLRITAGAGGLEIPSPWEFSITPSGPDLTINETGTLAETNVNDSPANTSVSITGSGLARGAFDVATSINISPVNLDGQLDDSIIRVSGSFSFTAADIFYVPSSVLDFQRQIIGTVNFTDSPLQYITAEQGEYPSSGSIGFNLVTAYRTSARLTLSAGGSFAFDDRRTFSDNDKIADVSFSASVSISVLSSANKTIEFWLGGDRQALMLWELSSSFAYNEGVSVAFNVATPSNVDDLSETDTVLPFVSSGSLDGPGNGLTAATVGYSITATSNSLQMSGDGSAETRTEPNGFVNNPAGAAEWSVSTAIELGQLNEGIYQVNSIFTGSLTGDFSKTHYLDETPFGDQIVSFEGLPYASFTTSWGPVGIRWGLSDPGVFETQAVYVDDMVGSFTRVLEVREGGFALTLSAEIGRSIIFRNDQLVADEYAAGSWGGGLNWNVTFGLIISEIPEAYLAASKNYLYAFIRNSSVARYIKIAVSGIETATEYSSGQPIVADPEDWRRSRATFAVTLPTDPDPCNQQNRLNDFVNLQEGKRNAINAAQDIDGTPLQNKLLNGESIQRAAITTESATPEDSRCVISGATAETVKTIRAIVTPDETLDVTIRSIVPYSKK